MKKETHEQKMRRLEADPKNHEHEFARMKKLYECEIYDVHTETF